MRRMFVLSALVALFSASPHPASADPIVLPDQQNVGEWGGGLGNTRDVALGQTFTVGIGGVLTQVDVMVFYPHEDYARFTDPLSVELRTTSNGRPTETVLQSIDVAPQALPTVRNVMTSVPGFSVDVSAGELLALVLSTGSPEAEGNYGWGYRCCYARGEPFITGYGPGWSPATAASPQATDFIFRTWVAPQLSPGGEAPVPEPGTMILLSSGLAGLLAARRRCTAP